MKYKFCADLSKEYEIEIEAKDYDEALDLAIKEIEETYPDARIDSYSMTSYDGNSFGTCFPWRS